MGGENSNGPKNGVLLVQGQNMPSTLYILPLVEKPFFPAQAQPLLIHQTPWLSTIKAIGETEYHYAGLILLKTEDIDTNKVFTRKDFYTIGTVVRVHEPMYAEERIQFIAEGLQRFRVVRWLSKKPPLLVRVEYLPTQTDERDEVKAYAMAIINSIRELVPLNPLYSEELKFFLNRFNPHEPSYLTDFAASLTSATKQDLQQVLELLPVLSRMEKVLILLKKELELARLQSKIRNAVEEQMSEQQRRFFLKEQLKAIQKELGLAKDDRTADLERYQARLSALTIPPETQQRIEEELQKMAMLEAGSPEYTVTRNYLDWITALPWGIYCQDNLDLAHARQVLDADHDYLDDVKKRIIEFLAVGHLKGAISGAIILLVGPPGVGKTSIGRSLATALGRPFFRFSLGGMRDEAEIKGHRRTYIGAMPGKLINALKVVKYANPVIMLDEIDKIGASFQGDPASALLEVLDPEQNNQFLDHYLDVPFDLSKVLFMATANQLDSIPLPLLDRMEIIRLAGYITVEKMAIARHHLWPKQLQRANLIARQLTLSDAALHRMIEGYAREAGVRQLEQLLAKVVRKAAVQFIDQGVKRLSITVSNLESYLDNPPFRPEKSANGIGLVTGLAWTALGGAILTIEAAIVHSTTRGLKLTGQLGEVMKESVDIAYSYIQAHLADYGVVADFFHQRWIHVHVPEGATPKDGPSAGVTMATALLSLARQQAIVPNIAMTGEITLSGQVLAVGGIREKIIAARRSGINTLILPRANEADFNRLPGYIREGLTVWFAQTYQDIFRKVFLTE